jgi:HD-GYP domain-containing protein (c-di-GMP phosphodiesterase class II)
MKKIKIESLFPGHVTEGEYCNNDGKLLIAAGVTITQHHIDSLLRRNVFELYLKDKHSEIRKIIDSDLKNINELHIDQRPEADSNITEVLKQLGLTASGEEGYKQLAESHLVKGLDRTLSMGRISDRPIGKTIKNEMQQLFISARPEQYKQEISMSYGLALNEVRKLLTTLASGSKVDSNKIRAIVETFMKTFVIDHNILLAMSTLKPAPEDYLFHHSLNVCLLTINIAASAGYSEEQMIQMGMGALLHDVGMLLVPESIRLKTGRLTNDEWYEIRKHPLLSLHLLDKLVSLPDAIKFITYQIHERENGTGYPKNRSSRLIHAYAKIAQVADIFEAVSSPRIYRQAYAPYKGMEMLIKMTRTGLINSEFVKSFLSFASLFPIGSLVQLNDNRIGRVISANQTKFAKPLISILAESNGQVLKPEQIYQVDLSTETDIQVIRSLPFESVSKDILHGF